MKLNWNNFPTEREGGKTKNLLWGEYGYFVELRMYVQHVTDILFPLGWAGRPLEQPERDETGVIFIFIYITTHKWGPNCVKNEMEPGKRFPII